MPSYRDLFPEWDCIEQGDPYLTEIGKADDIIDDHRYNAAWLGLDESQAAATAEWVERQRLSYELAALYAWWARPDPDGGKDA
jgi:hypothetical protein